MNDYFTPPPTMPPVPPGPHPFGNDGPTSVLVSAEEKKRLRRGIRLAGNKNGVLLLGFVGLTNLLVLLAGFLLRRFLPEGLSDSLRQSIGTLTTFFLQYAVVVPVLLVINRMGQDRVKVSFQRPALGDGELAKWCVMAFGCAYAVNFIFAFLSQFLQTLGLHMASPSLILQPTLLDNLTTLVFFAMAAPLCEELFFRGALLGNLRRHGEWFAVLMVALMFGLAHLNFQQMFYAGVMGIFAGYIVIRSGSIIPAVCMHFFLNLIGATQSILLSHLGADKMLEAIGGMNLDWISQNVLPLSGVMALSVLCMVLMVIGVVLFCLELARSRRNTGRAGLPLPNSCPALSAGEKLLTYLTAPGTLAFVLFALTIAVLRTLGMAA